ncbi:hypothetical protein ACHAQA_003459 [Verticillium albo-atrum]
MTGYQEEPRRSRRTRKATVFYIPNDPKTQVVCAAISTSTMVPAGSKRKAADTVDEDDSGSPLSSPPRSPTTNNTTDSAAPAVTTTPGNHKGAGRTKDAKDAGDKTDVTAHGPAKKKQKTTRGLEAEAYQEVHGSVAGDDLPLAMAAYLVARNNQRATWTRLEVGEAQVAALLEKKTRGDFAAVRRTAFNTLMDERIKAAKRAFNKLRFARRAEYNRGAVEEARRQLDLAWEVRALGPDWMPDLALAQEVDPASADTGADAEGLGVRWDARP